MRWYVAAVAVWLVVAALPAVAAESVAPAEAWRQVQAGQVTMVDVRTPDEWRQTGVAPTARRLDLSQGAEAFVAEVTALVDGDKSRPLAIICRTGHRSAQAQALLAAQGFTRVVNVEGGMLGGAAGPGWLKAGLPTAP